MAGLLDSDFVRFLAGTDDYYRYKQQQGDTAKFQGLLGTLEQQGPTRPDEGLLGLRQPDQQFWLKAAQLPTYQSLAGQQLGYEAAGQQAMERQTQGQNWQAENMTLAQRQAQALEQMKAQATWQNNQDQLVRQWYQTNASANASNASAANSMASRDLNQSKLIKQNRENQGLLGGVPYDSLTPIQKVEGSTKMRDLDRSAAGAIDVADWARDRRNAAALPGFLGTSEAQAMNQEWQFSVKPVVMEMLHTGVLQGEEQEMVSNLMGKPADYVLSEGELNGIESMMQKVLDRRQDTYSAYGKPPTEIKPGSSAVARTLNKNKKVKPAGDLSDVTTRPGGSGGYTRFR